MGARYYDAATGRFLSEDLAFLAVGDAKNLKDITKFDQSTVLSDPQSLNSYSYARNNPIINRDADGNFFFLAPLLIPAAITAVAAIGAAIAIWQWGTGVGYMSEGDYATASSSFDASINTSAAAGSVVGGIMVVGEMVSPGSNNSRNQSVTVSVSDRNAQKGFTKHGSDFGMSGNWNPSRTDEFRNVINQYVNNADVQAIDGTYRGTLDVTHYYNPQTNVDVMVDKSGNYVGGWRLSGDQASSLIKKGNVQ
jgi:RHS repeat-associated protein